MDQQPADSQRGTFDIRWRLFGIQFCIQPSFWFMTALWGFIMLQMSGDLRISRNLLTFIAIWVGCTLVSIIVHELGHVIVGRLFGQPGNITLSSFGGQAGGRYDKLSPWRRIIVGFCGPLAGFVFLAVIVAFDNFAWNALMGSLDIPWAATKWCYIERYREIQLNPIFFLAMNFLVLMNLIWNIINLFPIIPMDGGMIMLDGLIIVSKRNGPLVAFGFSFFLAGVLSIYCILACLQKYGVLPLPIKLETLVFPEFAAIQFAMTAWSNFGSLRELLSYQRHEGYQERDDG